MSLAKAWKVKFNTTPPQSETTMQLVLDLNEFRDNLVTMKKLKEQLGVEVFESQY